jgi:hypothetical protein
MGRWNRMKTEHLETLTMNMNLLATPPAAIHPLLKLKPHLAILLSFVGGFANAQQSASPAKVVGTATCAQCHAAEHAAWEHSSHNLKAWKLLDHPKAAQFAKALGVTDIKGNSACTKCHGTHQLKQGKLVITQGNSCESCHGGAGGDQGWLATHSDFGLGTKVTAATKLADLLAQRGQETAAHRGERDAACKTAGMNRSSDALSIARNCLQCHLVPDEKLVEAGHPMSTRFEFVEWAQGEVRHNFLLNPKVNAEAPTNWTDELRNGPGRTTAGRKRLMLVVGQLADLEVSLRNRANATSTKRGTLGDEANDRILDLQEELADLKIPELAGVATATKSVNKKGLRAVSATDKETYNAIADAVANAAEAFVAAHPSGANLPTGLKVPTKAKGDVHQP